MNSTPDIRPATGLVRWFLRKFGYGGITLPPVAVFIIEERLSDERLIKHEEVHWRQAKQMGTMKFYFLYLYYSIRYGYWNHPMEVEARAAEMLQ
jgi:hypothetical protein